MNSNKTSTSPKFRAFLVVACALIVATICVHGVAHATRTTGLQANGSECVTFTNDFTQNRNELGLYNTSGSSINVECPIIDASDDSYPLDAPIKRVEVHYRGSAPTCHLEARNLSGSVSSSPNLTATTSPLSGLPVLRLASSWTAGLAGSTSSFIIWCTIPVDSWIVGLTAVRDHMDIRDGV